MHRFTTRYHPESLASAASASLGLRHMRARTSESSEHYVVTAVDRGYELDLAPEQGAVHK